MPLNHPITPALLADPEIFQQNRLPFHAHFADQTSPELPLTVSLDGEWNFRYAENLTAPFSEWDTLTVPGFIQMQSLQKPGQPYGAPHYVNTQYPWDGHEKLHPGQIPQDYNPIGEYQRSFALPESWASCYLRLNGADSAAAVWCNDVYIGYTEDTFTPAEFDMTAAVHPGENTLTVQVYRFSSGSWLEDQDFWRMSGLFRSVELFTKPEIHLEDVFVKQDFAPDFSSATVTFDCKVSGAGTVSVVFDGEEQSAEVGEPAEYDSGVVFGKGESDPDVEEDVQDVSFTFTVEHPALWSAEQPNLYEAEIALLREGALVERTGLKVGLRKFELKDRQMLLNGQRIVFKGVNRHEWSCRTGRTVSREEILWDVKNLKAHNVNAIRTCHYPQQRRFYELCDSLGFYVYSEANVESHGMGYDLAAGRTLGNDRAWWPAHETRLRNMYMRCRNYPSVSIFSPANESGNGYNFYKAYEWLEAREKGEGRMNRPICYERAQWEWNTDMFVPMYPTAGMLEEWGREGTDRPVVPCEYSHAMGNSNGSLWLQWQSIYKYPNLQGGFIWDWVDQGFERRDAAGTLYWTYGGDYGDREPSDGNFCCNGLVSPDRTPHPAMAEVRYAYADIAFRPVGPARGSFEVENRFYFTSLDGYDIVYTVEADGKAVRSGTVRLQTAPQQRETVDAAVGKLKPGRNYYLRLRAVTRTDRRGLPAGTVVAEEQFPLQKGALPAYEKEGERLALSTQGDRIEATNDRVRFAINRTTGAALSYEIDGTELFADGFGVRPNFWRAPVDNDYGDGMPRRTQVWKEASRDADAEVTGRMEGDAAVIAATRALAGGNRVTTTYTVYPSGAVNVRMHFAPGEEPMPEMPRYGVRFRLPERMDAFAYFGRGPEENYWDRKAGTFVGRYETSARRECFPYVRPQETGHHCDTEWIDFGELLIVADSTMEFNALRCTVEDLDGEQAVGRDYQWHNWTKSDSNEVDKARNAMRRQTHVNDIPVRDFVEVCLDYRQMGLGGYDSWGKRPEESVTLRTGKLRDWGFTLVPKRARK